MATDKDTIYVDIDDEITGIIDKVRSSDGKVVALVLPKRASVFQSIVNMKLLKRAAADAKKNLVLITTESGLMPLAGAAGLYVASSLNSKPEIPNAPIAPIGVEETVEEIDDDLNEVTAENAGDKPVGELAGMPATKSKGDEMETLELDNEEPEDKTPIPAASGKKSKKDKKLNVPNFERFRLLVILGVVALILLIVGLVFAFKVMPKAVISIDTDARSVSIDRSLKLSTAAKSVHLGDGTLPAKLVKQTKTYTQQVPATGEKNNGNKAAGDVTLTLCASNPSQVQEVPAGAGVSSGGKTYITQESSNFSFAGGSCGSGFKFTSKVGILAQSGGSNFNVSNASFTVSGSGATGTGSASGGTDNIVKVVSESDIAAAKGKINTQDPTVKTALTNDLKSDNYFAIGATFTAAEPSTSNSAEVGDAATSVTVTATVNYTMFGVQQSDLKQLIEDAAKEQIDIQKQSILNDGIDDAVFNISSQNDKEAELSMHTELAVGPQLDVASIKQDAAGKKSGEVRDNLKTNPDVTDVEVKLSPFWVKSVPKNLDKITVDIAKPKPVSNSNNAD